MEKPPARYEVVKETPYGPHLKRVSHNELPGEVGGEVNTEPPIPSVDLPPQRRIALRNTMLALGIALVPADIAEDSYDTDSPKGQPRIEELDVSAYAPERAPVPTPRPQLEGVNLIPSNESIEFLTEPERRIEGYAATWTLPYDHVLFVDETNRPIATVPLSVVYEEQRTKESGEPFLYANTSRYGGGLDFPPAGIPKEWLDASREKLGEKSPGGKIGGQYNVIQDFKAALREDDEPELVARIKSGEITTSEGIVRYFADKPVVGAEEYSRLEYVFEKIAFPDIIPERVQSELRRLIPGLAAQESKFNNDLKSSDGAEGILQLMPATSQGLRMKPEEINSLIKQVEAVGRHFGNIYQELHSAIKAETLAVVRSWYESEEAYEKYFLTPMMITAYNVGGTRMAEAVEAFVAEHPSLIDAPDNLATFFTLTDYAKESKAGRLAKFDVAGASYYTKVAAAAEVFSPIHQ